MKPCSRSKTIKVAIELVAECGPSVSLRHVAAKAGVSHSGISKIFGSKREMVQAAVDAAVEAIGNDIENVARGRQGPDSKSVKNILREGEKASCIFRAITEGDGYVVSPPNKANAAEWAVALAAISALRSLRSSAWRAVGMSQIEADRAFFRMHDTLSRGKWRKDISG